MNKNDKQNMNDPHELIQVVGEVTTHGIRWRPIVRSETLNLLGNIGLSEHSQNIIRDEAVSILSRCTPPTDISGQETGLVVGYIQSGKTMSFTTVAALACDNYYPMVIVIVGTSVPLTEQSVNRLKHDLRFEQREDRKWRHIHNPQLQYDDHTRISAILDEWRDNTVPPEERRTVLVTVMKHHGRLNQLIDVLRFINLQNVPVLIVDDEADQAGLNNLIRDGKESTTYQRLRVLKELIPHHIFLQYTATPQGPLLINLIDVLSPDFAMTLNPGPQYVGGADFFLEGAPHISEIPTNEIPTRNNPLQVPPDSLLAALRVFFLGVATGLVHEHGRGNRSMMIHPSQRTVGHKQYYDWVTSVRDSWIQILEHPDDPDYIDLIDDFRDAYNDLYGTVENLDPFDTLSQRLLHALRRTEMHLVNARRGRTPQIDWNGAYSHILVGGQALDRGVTVEGLTVTYMPRGVGARRADTIQQRARFFGYKREYFGFCRVFLEQAIADAFHRYVEHEEDVRRRLDEHANSGQPLSELRRTFLLTRMLMPTRDSIIDIDYVRANFNESWFYPRAPHDTHDAVLKNRGILSDFIETLNLVPDDGHSERTPIQSHMVASEVSLQYAYETFLTLLRFSRLSDAQNFLGVLVIIGRFLVEHQDATCSVYQMSCGLNRVRHLNEKGEIPNLLQGAHPVNPPERRGDIYPGDRAIKTDDDITIQIHNLNIPAQDNTHENYRDVPNIAIWIPRGITGDVLIQDQGNLMVFEDE